MKKKILYLFIIIILVNISSNIVLAEEVYNINDVVQKGDYVTYSAGVWKKEEIEKLVSQGIYHYDVPEGMVATFSFSGFDVGDSKDIIVNETYSTGWRILLNENETIKIISTGSTEKYYLPFGTNKAYIAKYELTGEKDEYDNTNETEDVPVRDWGVYENPEYALLGYAHIPTGQEIFDITGSQDATNNNLRNIGENYITSTVHCDEDMWTVETNGYMDRWGNRMLGIRPVIHLKSTLKVIKIGESDDGYNIWKLLTEENIVNKEQEENKIEDIKIEENIEESNKNVDMFNTIKDIKNKTNNETENRIKNNIVKEDEKINNQVEIQKYETDNKNNIIIFIIIFITIILFVIVIIIFIFKKYKMIE